MMELGRKESGDSMEELMIRVNAGYKRGMIATIRLTMDPV